jgi:hypothetical protein
MLFPSYHGAKRISSYESQLNVTTPITQLDDRPANLLIKMLVEIVPHAVHLGSLWPGSFVLSHSPCRLEHPMKPLCKSLGLHYGLFTDE